jgi:plasmid stabilization system protein ParE
VHVEYLSDRELDVALRFVDAVELACQRISENPETGFIFGFESIRLREVRVLIVPEFPNHLVFFRKQADEVRVLRVLHASRDITREFEDHEPC